MLGIEVGQQNNEMSNVLDKNNHVSESYSSENFEPGAARFGNFINYYSFNSVSKRLDVIPPKLLSQLDLSHEPILCLDIGCNSGELTIELYSHLISTYEEKPNLLILGIDLDDTLIVRSNESNIFPCHLFFRRLNIMEENALTEIKAFLQAYNRTYFDLVCCFSTTMWIHLNHGDEGLEKFLKTASGITQFLLLEPQEWKCYRTAVRRMTRLNKQVFPIQELKMDLKDTVQVFCSPGIGLTKSQVAIDWSEEYNMKLHPLLHPFIEETWQQRSKDSVILFDATKFRLEKVDASISNSEIRVKFLVGTTSYKEFIGTHYSKHAQRLIEDGVKLHSDAKAFLSNPIGVGAILQTEDGYLVFMRRSLRCAEMPGLLDRPGGHPEPKVVLSNIEKCCGADRNMEVRNEIFNSVLQEIKDEISVPVEFLSDPLLLGISYNPETYGRPSFEFYVRCCLSMKRIEELYLLQTHPEKEESTALYFMPVPEAVDVQSVKASKIYSELTHAAQCALHLLQIFLTSGIDCS